MVNLIHICFSDSARGSLKYAIQNQIISGDKIIVQSDELSNGPISNGVQLKQRINWNKKIFTEYIDESINYLKQNYFNLDKEIKNIKQEDTVYIWFGNNALEMTGVMFILKKLSLPLEKIYLINVSESKLISKCGGEFFAMSTGQLAPEDFKELISSKKEIETKTYERLLNNWRALEKDNGLLRIYQDGKIVTVSEDYFDKQILKYTQKEFVNSAKVVGKVLENIDQLISDTFIFFRIQKLVQRGMLDFRGDSNIMMELEVKLK